MIITIFSKNRPRAVFCLEPWAEAAADFEGGFFSDVGGKGFAEDGVYSIATITYLCDGGDTYYAFKEADDIEQPVTFGFDYEAVVSYLVTECDHVVPEEYAEPQGRITIIGV